jgi:hypothetical protein
LAYFFRILAFRAGFLYIKNHQIIRNREGLCSPENSSATTAQTPEKGLLWGLAQLFF